MSDCGRVTRGFEPLAGSSNVNSVEERCQTFFDTVGDVECESLDRRCRIHATRGNPDTTIHNEEISYIVAASPFIYYRARWIQTHTRGAEQMTRAVEKRPRAGDVS